MTGLVMRTVYRGYMMTPLDYATLAVIVVIVVLALVSVALLLGVGTGAGRTGGKQAPATTVVIGEQNDSDQVAGADHPSGNKVVITEGAVRGFVEALKKGADTVEEDIAPVVNTVEEDIAPVVNAAEEVE
jgi:hypothetical protein